MARLYARSYAVSPGHERRHHVPRLRASQRGGDAHERLPVLLPLHRLRTDAATARGRLLRVLLLRRPAVPAEGGRCPRLIKGRSPTSQAGGCRRCSTPCCRASWTNGAGLVRMSVLAAEVKARTVGGGYYAMGSRVKTHNAAEQFAHTNVEPVAARAREVLACRRPEAARRRLARLHELRVQLAERPDRVRRFQTAMLGKALRESPLMDQHT